MRPNDCFRWRPPRRPRGEQHIEVIIGLLPFCRALDFVPNPACRDAQRLSEISQFVNKQDAMHVCLSKYSQDWICVILTAYHGADVGLVGLSLLVVVRRSKLLDNRVETLGVIVGNHRYKRSRNAHACQKGDRFCCSIAFAIDQYIVGTESPSHLGRQSYGILLNLQIAHRQRRIASLFFTVIYECILIPP